MTELSDDAIESRACELWEISGKPEGRAIEFLAVAQEELRNADQANTPQALDTF